MTGDRLEHPAVLRRGERSATGGVERGPSGGGVRGEEIFERRVAHHDDDVLDDGEDELVGVGELFL